MSNTPALGLSVDSSQVVAGTKDLNALSASAAKAEAAATKLGKMGGKALKDAGTAAGFSKREIAEFERAMAGAARQMVSVESAAAKASANTTKFGAGLKGVNDNARLTSNQMLNLSRQGNDVITMFALGANPMQIFASQAGQIVDALQSGPGGLKGSLKAIGTELGLLAARWGPMALGVGAVAGATYLVWKAASGPEAKSAEDALKGYSDLVESLETGYKAAADAASDFYAQASQEGRSVALAGVQGTAVELRASLAREIEVLFARTQSFITKWDDLSPAVLAGQQSIRELGDQLRAGDLTAAQFREKIADIRINPETPRVVVEIADKLLDASVNARSLETAIGAVGQAASVASEKVGRLSVPTRQDMGPFERLNPDGFKSLVDGLNAQADAMKKVSDDATKEYVRAAKEREAAIFDELATIVKAQERMIDLIDRLSSDRAGLFMPDSEARIASMLKPYGLGLDSVEAGYIRQTERLKEYRDLNREVWTGIGSDIIQNGVKPMEAMENAFKNVTGRIFDQAITGLADGLFNSIFGGQETLSVPTQANVGLSEANAMWVRMAGTGIGGVERGGALAAVQDLAANANDNMSRYRDAIAAVESRGSGDYSALGPVTKKGDRAYGRYQVMGSNIPSWSEAALGQRLTPQQFLANPGYQDRIFDHRFGGYVQKYGNASDAASTWFTGRPLSRGADARDQLGTSGSQYVDKFNAEIEKLSGSATKFQSDFDQTLNDRLTPGLTSTVDSFLPGLGGALQSLLSGLAGGGGGAGIFSSVLSLIPGFASGTNSAPGGLAVVGERGPELVNLPRGSQVVPNNRISAPRMPSPATANGTTINFAPVIDARGADQAAIARLDASLREQADGLKKMNQTFEKRVDNRTKVRETRGVRG